MYFYVFFVVFFILGPIGLGTVSYVLHLLIVRKTHQLKQLPKKIALGTLVAFSVVGILVTIVYVSSLPNRENRREIDHLYRKQYDLLLLEQYQSAYELMSSGYQKERSVEEFSKDFRRLEPASVTRDIDFRGNAACFYVNGYEWLTAGARYELVKEEESWRFTGKYDYLLD